MPETVRQQLATSLLRRPVGEWILERHRAKCTYERIAAELAEATGGQVAVSKQAIHQWRKAATNKERT
jgi:hypothetical protein